MKRKQYSAEYKQQAVYRFTEGKEPVSAIAKDLGIAVCSLRDWIKQVKTRDNPFPGAGKQRAQGGHRNPKKAAP